MPKYKVLEKSLIGNEIHEAGAIVEYAGLPSENLEPQCDEGRAKYQEYLVTNNARVKAMKEQFSESAVGDQVAFAKMIATAVSEALFARASFEEGVKTPDKALAAVPKNAKAESLT